MACDVLFSKNPTDALSNKYLTALSNSMVALPLFKWLSQINKKKSLLNIYEYFLTQSRHHKLFSKVFVKLPLFLLVIHTN